ncbi:LysR substrate-binding domain-containing protein [Neisseria sp. Ec49-e6-T10]|uniref:LysR substrate-binding domain-containing protein n=1 Tax=Neisseria sp. Ec49-e6-T10 TaxID=3140744 RepID=UPI003EB70A6F
MENLNDLYYFVSVIKHGGFSAAARALNLPKATLSRRISQLEDRLGLKLLYRSTRKLSLTESGEVYFQHCLAMVEHAVAAQHAIENRQSEPSGLIKISSPVNLVHSHVAKIIAQFMKDFPKVKVHLLVTNRRVDLIEEGIDIALRVRFPPLENSDLVLKPLADTRQIIVASAEYLKRFGVPKEPSDLARFDCACIAESANHYKWSLLQNNGEEVHLLMTPRLMADDLLTLKQAALEGVAVVKLPEYMVVDDIRDKKLVVVLPEWKALNGLVHAVYPSRKGQTVAMKSLLMYLEQGFSHEEVKIE